VRERGRPPREAADPEPVTYEDTEAGSSAARLCAPENVDGDAVQQPTGWRTPFLPRQGVPGAASAFERSFVNLRR
jgi:hypothetical protein